MMFALGLILMGLLVLAIWLEKWLKDRRFLSRLYFSIREFEEYRNSLERMHNDQYCREYINEFKEEN